MIDRRHLAALAGALLVGVPVLAIPAAPPSATGPTALDRYVAKPDPVFAWKLVNTIKGQGQTTYVIDLTSQTWRSASEVDHPVWKHWMTIVVPDSPVPARRFCISTAAQSTTKRRRRRRTARSSWPWKPAASRPNCTACPTSR